MASLLDLFGYLSVILRALTLATQSLVIGGVAFTILAVLPLKPVLGAELQPLLKSSMRLIAWSAVALALTWSMLLFVDSAVLMNTADLQLPDVIGANFFLAGTCAVICAAIIASLTRWSTMKASAAMAPFAILLLATSVATSHAAARVDNTIVLLIVTAMHHLATGTWIGGMPYLLLSLRAAAGEQVAAPVSSRFSKIALTSVILLAAAGVAMSVFYVGSVESLYGTAYGVMVMTKVALFGMLLPLGALNFFIVRQASTNAGRLQSLTKRFAEAEIWIGFTVILAAASLTSQPPAADMTFARVDSGQIIERIMPRWPTLKSPNPQDLSTPALQLQRQSDASGTRPESYVPGSGPARPNTPDDIAWSEYNHHWSGLIVLFMGLLAVAAGTGRAKWARNWPLVFIGLAAFVFLRSDPENWPLGPNGFWESFADSEVLQHRAFVLLIIALAVFEWAAQTGRIASKRASLVFPLICGVGGAMLLTHSHSLGNVKEELLAELSHVPLALLGVLAGCSRWLELRLPASKTRVLSLIWPVCLVLSGAILLMYRES